MYYILMDAKTKSFYMKPRECAFYAYADAEDVMIPPDSNIRMVETECETKMELTTMLYNAGFRTGYINDVKIVLTKEDAFYYDMNPNEVAYAQYLLTGETSMLEEIIVKNRLLSVCKIEDNLVYFPTVELGNGDFAVLTYTDISRIPPKLFKKYQGFRIVKMTFDVKCVVNDKFIAE